MSQPAIPTTPTARQPRDKTEPKELIDWVKNDILDAQTLGFFRKIGRSRNIRNCWWPDKAVDAEYGSAPYGTRTKGLQKGSLDHEVRVVDGQCNAEVDLALHAFFSSEKIVRPRDAMNDDQTIRAEAWRHAMEFYLDATKGQLLSNLELFANIRAESGQAVWYEGWKDHWRKGKKTMKWHDVVEAATSRATAAQGGAEEQGEPAQSHQQEQTEEQGENAELAQKIAAEMELLRTDPQYREVIKDLVLGVDVNISKAEANKVATALCKGEDSVDYYAPVKVTALPVHRAYLPGVDCFYPCLSRATEEDHDGVPRMAFVEWYTEARLRTEAAQDGWDKEFLQDVLEKGAGLAFTFSGDNSITGAGWELNGVDTNMGYNTAALKNAGLYQIVTLWYWGVGDDGLPAPYRAIMHPQASQKVAKNECDPYGTGKMPYLLETRTMKSPRALNASGVSDEMLTNQAGRKKLEDAMIAQTELRANPPRVETTDMSANGGLRPGATITLNSRYLKDASTMLLSVPDISGGSIRMLEWMKSEEDSYYMRGKDTDPNAARLRLRVQLAKWCSFYEKIIGLMCLNIQNQVEEIQLGSVSGVAVNWTIKQEDLQGELDIVVRCDEGSVDFELAMKRLDAVMKLLPLNQNGTLVTDEVLRRALMMIQPDLVRGAISSPEQAQDRIRKDENQRLSDMLNGITLQWNTQADAPELRQQVLQDWLSYPPNQIRLQSDQKLDEQWQNETKWITFAIQQQQQNPMIGRTGVDPKKAAA